MCDLLQKCTDIGLAMSSIYVQTKRNERTITAGANDITTRRTREIPGLHNPVGDDELVDLMADVNKRAGNIVEADSEVDVICKRIEAYLEDWDVKHLIDYNKMTNTVRTPPGLYAPMLSGKFALFTAIWLNTFGASSTDVLCDVLHVFADRSISGEDDTKRRRSEKNKVTEGDDETDQPPIITKLTDDDCTDPDGRALDGKIKHLLEELNRNHLKHSKVVNVTKDMLEDMKKERRTHMTPKVLSTDKLYHEVFTYLLEPEFSRKMFEEYTENEEVRVVTLDERDHDNDIERLELCMTGRPVSLRAEIPIVTRQVHKLMLPKRFLFKESDSSPLLDKLFNCVSGFCGSDIVYLNGLNRLTWFTDMKSSSDVLDKIKDVENYVEQDCNSLRENRDIASKLKLLWVKTTMMVVWVTLFNLFKPDGNDISIGRLDDSGCQGGEVMIANMNGPGGDCMRMNDYTLYYKGSYYYMCDPRNRLIVYKCRNYKKLILTCTMTV
jgi:hypothetical protein